MTTGGRSLRQRNMRSVVVVVADVIIHESFQMPRIEHDHVVEQIATAVADPALSDTVLPRTPEAGSLGLDTKALHRFEHLVVELCASIKDQVNEEEVTMFSLR